MPVGSSDLQHFASASAGSSGGAITASGITSGVKNNVNPDISDAARIAGGEVYRKTFFKNNHGTDAMLLPVTYYPVAPAGCTYFLGIGIDSSADDDALQGNMTAFAAAAQVSVESDGADTRVVTVLGINNATGLPLSQDVTLTGAVAVLTAATFSRVFRVTVPATSGTRIITVKQGAAGAVRGTIGLNKRLCWLWVAAGTTKASGIVTPDLPAGQSVAVWRRLVHPAGAASVKPTSPEVKFEEN